MKVLFVSVFILVWLLAVTCPLSVAAQFNSGSTGADGALDLSIMNCTVCIVQLPETGVLNYTTVNVAAGKEVWFRRNSRNTPVYLLAQGNVTINGRINVSSPCEEQSSGQIPCVLGTDPGNGGFYGGLFGQSGEGPGAGQNGNPGRWIGPLTLVPLVGGSGGSFWSGSVPFFYGGGGGGAIALLSSASIVMGSNSRIGARGGDGGGLVSGSGGAIRIAANSVNIAGILAVCTVGTNCGVIRIEAQDGQRVFTGSADAPAVLSTINPETGAASIPQLNITSIEGYAVPIYAGSRFDTVDLLLPNQLPDPLHVAVQAVNIPSGTQVQVRFVNGSPNGASTPCTLTGGPGPLSCTATISNLVRSGVTYLLVTAEFNPPAALARFLGSRENQVDHIQLESKLGEPTRFKFFNSRNKEINAALLSKEVSSYFGLISKR